MDELILTLLMSVILTACSYMAFPVIRIIINHGRFSKKQAHKIALWNSIVVGAIFCILTIATSESGTVWHAGPAFLYYGINRAILTDKNAKQDEREKNKTTSTTITKARNSSTSSSPVNTPVEPSIKIQLSDPDAPPSKPHGNWHIYADDVLLKTENTPNADVSPTGTINAPPAPSLPRVQFCRKCGNKLEVSHRFCGECGTKVYENNTQ